jgi:hypothetical protein
LDSPEAAAWGGHPTRDRCRHRRRPVAGCGGLRLAQQGSFAHSSALTPHVVEKRLILYMVYFVRTPRELSKPKSIHTQLTPHSQSHTPGEREGVNSSRHERRAASPSRAPEIKYKGNTAVHVCIGSIYDISVGHCFSHFTITVLHAAYSFASTVDATASGPACSISGSNMTRSLAR